MEDREMDSCREPARLLFCLLAKYLFAHILCALPCLPGGGKFHQSEMPRGNDPKDAELAAIYTSPLLARGPRYEVNSGRLLSTD